MAILSKKAIVIQSYLDGKTIEEIVESGISKKYANKIIKEYEKKNKSNVEHSCKTLEPEKSCNCNKKVEENKEQSLNNALEEGISVNDLQALDTIFNYLKESNLKISKINIELNVE